MTHDVIVLFGMCACGVLCSVLFDMFRGVHGVLGKHDVMVIISDALYWAAAAAVIIYSLWRLNTGVLRAYEFVGLILGAVIYFCTVSRFVYRFFLTIDRFCVKITKRICKILLTLGRFLYKISVAPVKRAKKCAKRIRTGGG